MNSGRKNNGISQKLSDVKNSYNYIEKKKLKNIPYDSIIKQADKKRKRK